MRPPFLALFLPVMILPGCRHTPDGHLAAPAPSPPAEISVGPPSSPGPAEPGIGQAKARLLVIEDETEEPIPGATVPVLVQKGHRSCYPRYVIAEVTTTDRSGIATYVQQSAGLLFEVSAGGYCETCPLDSADMPDGAVRLVPGDHRLGLGVHARRAARSGSRAQHLVARGEGQRTLGER